MGCACHMASLAESGALVQRSVRSGGLRPDRLPPDRHARRGRAGGAGRDPRGTFAGPRPSAEDGRRRGAGRGRHRDRGPRRGAGHRALGQAGRGPHREEDLRASSARGVRRLRPGRIRGTGGQPAAAWERRLEHRRRPHRGNQARPGPTAQGLPARAADPDPHRHRRGHPRLPGLADGPRPVAVVLGRHAHHRADPPGRPARPGLGLDTHRRTRRSDPRRRLGRRTSRLRTGRLADRDAADRA
jgi:hypothetical protein